MQKHQNIAQTAIICFSNGKGGMELDAIKLTEMLHSELPVILICKEGSFLQQQCIEKNCKFLIETIYFHSRLFSISIIYNLRRLINEKNIKNIIFFGASELKSMYFAFLGKDINVIVRHGTTKSTRKNGVIHRLVYLCVNYHVAISEHIHKNVLQIIPIHKGAEIKTIYPSFKVFLEKPDEHHNNVLKIIHVGRIATGKGQIDAVKACKVLHENEIQFQLHIIGDIDNVEYYNKLRVIVDSCAYRDNITISKAVRNIREVYRSADILLFPSYGEGLGNVFLEAISAGLVCITYDNTTFPEFGGMGLNFHMINTGDIEMLSGKVLDVASNIEHELTCANENIDKLKEIFSEDREIEEWKSLLR